MSRLSREDYYISILEAVSQRGTCGRGRSGAIIVKDNRLLTTGYVGAPRGLPHCDSAGHEMASKNVNGIQTYHCVRSVHAEMNAIIQAARVGVSVEGGMMYCTMFPCYPCAQAIINSGIKNIVAANDYQDSEGSKRIFNTAGVHYRILNEKPLEY